MAELEENDYYLEANRTDIFETIYVSLEPDDSEDFTMSDMTTLNAMMDAMGEAYAESGLAISECEIYPHGPMAFIRLVFYMVEENVSVVEYYTIYGGNIVTIMLLSYGEELDPGQEAIMKNMVDSIVLNNVEPQQTQAEEVEPEAVEAEPEQQKSGLGGTYLVVAAVAAIACVVIFGKKRKASGPKRERYCRNCGAERVEGSKFCHECGAPLKMTEK